jgi:hypothetical protein
MAIPNSKVSELAHVRTSARTSPYHRDMASKEDHSKQRKDVLMFKSAPYLYLLCNFLVSHVQEL